MTKHFWCEDLTTAAGDCYARFPERKRQAVAQADAICGNRFVFSDHWEMERTHEPVHFDGEIDWALIPFGDPEWLYALNRHTCFLNLGKAYRYTGDERYAQKFAGLIADWIDRVPLTAASKSGTWRSLEAGLRCENWLRALRLFEKSPALTASLREKIDGCLAEHAAYLAATSDDFHRLSNWGVLQDHGLLLLGIYFGRTDYIALAAQRLDVELHLQVFRDGTHWEQSPMYHCEVLHCAADALLIARQNGVELPARYEKNVLAMCRALAAQLTPGGRIPCQSDSDDTDARDLVAMGAVLFADGGLKYAAGNVLYEENYWDFATDALTAYEARSPEPPIEHSAALPDSGNYMLRGSPDPHAAWLHMHCGCLGSGHGHADLLHIDVGVCGEDILIDSGRYTYVNTPLRRALKLPAAHNTTRVDSVDFSTCIDSWGYDALAQPLKGEYTFTETADYISGAHLGYMGLPEGGVLAGRKIVFLKPDIFVIFDHFYGGATARHTYEQYFHLNEGALTVSGNTAAWRGKKAAAQLLFLGDVTVTAGRAPYSRDYNLLCEGDVLHMEKRAEGFASFVTVIAVGEGAPPDITARLVPVTTVRKRNTLPDEKAQAVEVVRAGQSYTVLVGNGETVSEVDLLRAGGGEGYGKALVFTPDAPDGICLAW